MPTGATGRWTRRPSRSSSRPTGPRRAGSPRGIRSRPPRTSSTPSGPGSCSIPCGSPTRRSCGVRSKCGSGSIPRPSPPPSWPASPPGGSNSGRPWAATPSSVTSPTTSITIDACNARSAGNTTGPDEDEDLNVLNFERFKWGGVRHEQPHLRRLRPGAVPGGGPPRTEGCRPGDPPRHPAGDRVRPARDDRPEVAGEAGRDLPVEQGRAGHPGQHPRLLRHPADARPSGLPGSLHPVLRAGGASPSLR